MFLWEYNGKTKHVSMSSSHLKSLVLVGGAIDLPTLHSPSIVALLFLSESYIKLRTN